MTDPLFPAESFTSAVFTVPKTLAGGRALTPGITERLESLLAAQFGGFSIRAGKAAWHDAQTNQLLEEDVQVYEVGLLESRIGEVIGCAREIARMIGEHAILVEIGGHSQVVTLDETHPVRLRKMPGATKATSWPETTFDIAIQAVIAPELHALQSYFGIDPLRSQLSIEGAIYHKGKYISSSTGSVSVIVHCQGHPGNDAAAVAAERLISRWHPRAIFLVGIAAGRRDKCKIGDAVTPRVVVNDQLGVAQAQKRLKRTQIYPPPQPIVQQLMNFRLDSRKWHARLLESMQPPRAPRAKGEKYRKHVARRPRHHESAIYSSDLLLRDPNVLRLHAKETHEQIKVGEMEAAGFSYACQERTRPVPWFIVRGVSDFGDRFKSDEFHVWASHSAASYLLCLLEDGIRLDLMEEDQDSR